MTSVDPFTDPKLQRVRDFAVEIVNQAGAQEINDAALYLAATMVRNFLQDRKPELADKFREIDAAIESRRRRMKS